MGKNFKKIIALVGVFGTILVASNNGQAFAATNENNHKSLVNETMTKSEMLDVARSNNINIKFASQDSLDMMNKAELSKIINDSVITPQSIDGEIIVKRYKQSAPLKYMDGTSINASVFVTVVFDVYQDHEGKSIVGIRSVSSSLTSNGVSASTYEQDDTDYPDSITPTSSYTIYGKGIYSRAGVGNERVQFSLVIKPSYGSEY